MHRFLDPTTRVSDLVSLGWNLRAFISHKFPGALGVMVCIVELISFLCL